MTAGWRPTDCCPPENTRSGVHRMTLFCSEVHHLFLAMWCFQRETWRCFSRCTTPRHTTTSHIAANQCCEVNWVTGMDRIQEREPRPLRFLLQDSRTRTLSTSSAVEAVWNI
ncbi:uncharacterized protein LOC123502093 isoform X2 [Portunus trituberculatus]|uniref:uncharacterized protein LOC123502093 isoform X2 n=1 Tax=Portunus trituberculatus TaxID=210409 RepID=UPI001E1CD71D|nr:uncharacterized protein LOC123502093 isoform X2 [Portunus trituberculatus]